MKSNSNHQKIDLTPIQGQILEINSESTHIPLNSYQSENEVQNNSTEDGTLIHLLIQGLYRTTTEEQVKQHFQQIGDVLSVLVPLSKRLNRGFAFITKKNIEYTLNALSNPQFTRLCGKSIQIQIIQSNPIIIQNQKSYLEQISNYNLQTELEKSNSLDNLYSIIKQQDKYQLILQFDKEVLAFIKSILIDITTQSELIMLNILEYVCQTISDIPITLNKITYQLEINQTILFDDMQNSELIAKIESLFHQKTEKQKQQDISFPFQAFIKNMIKKEEKEVISYPICLEQLIRIYIMIMKGQRIKKQMLEIFTKVISKRIDQLIKHIQQQKKEQEIQVNNEIESITKTLNMIYESSIYLMQQTIITQRIQVYLAPLIHICCPQELNCPQNICKNMTLYLQDLLLIVFKLLLIDSKDLIIQFQQKDNSIIHHLAIPIISFALSCSIHKHQNNIIQQKQLNFNTPSIIANQLQLLHYLLFYNYQNLQYSMQNTNLILSLIKLSNYRNINKITEGIEEKDNLLQISHFSRLCLYSIEQLGDISEKQKLLDNGYVLMNLILLGIDDYSDVRQDIQINQGLIHIIRLIESLRQGKKSHIIRIQGQSFPPQKALVKTCMEQIEEEGGNEEIESQLINKGRNKDFDCIINAEWLDGRIINNAISAKEKILNLYKNRSIERLFWNFQ